MVLNILKLLGLNSNNVVKLILYNYTVLHSFGLGEPRPWYRCIYGCNPQGPSLLDADTPLLLICTVIMSQQDKFLVSLLLAIRGNFFNCPSFPPVPIMFDLPPLILCSHSFHPHTLLTFWRAEKTMRAPERSDLTSQMRLVVGEWREVISSVYSITWTRNSDKYFSF